VGRLKDPADAAAWETFNRNYRDLIVRYLRARGLQLADAEDAAQTVLAKLVTGLRAFDYDRAKGTFRGYLFQCSKSVLYDHFSRQNRHRVPVSLIDGDGAENTGSHATGADSAAFAEFEREWVDHHFRLAVARLREGSDARGKELLEATLAARPARLIAREHAMSENAVHKAQQRIRDRLRAYVAEQVHEEEGDNERRA
jgi:RNA polymerase sigma-70 factor (ECF subfamily)